VAKAKPRSQRIDPTKPGQHNRQPSIKTKKYQTCVGKSSNPQVDPVTPLVVANVQSQRHADRCRPEEK